MHSQSSRTIVESTSESSRTVNMEQFRGGPGGDRRNGARPNHDQASDSGGGGLFGLLAGVAAAGAAGYAAYKFFQSGDDPAANQSSSLPRAAPSSSFHHGSSSYGPSAPRYFLRDSDSDYSEPQDDSDEEAAIVIVVNATPERAAGIIKFKDKIVGMDHVWYYSVPWKPLIRFPSEPDEQVSDRIEIANALLGAHVAKDALRTCRNGKVDIKMDNTVSDNSKKHKEFMNAIEDVLEGRFRKLVRGYKTRDPDLNNADKLSRNPDEFKKNVHSFFRDADLLTDKSEVAARHRHNIVEYLPMENRCNW